jgi:PAS domain S-box-containing protein
MLNTVVDGIVTLDDGGLIQSLNPTAVALFGYDEAEAIGQPLTLLVEAARHDGFRDLANPQVPLAQTGTDNRSVETRGCRRDGSTFTMELAYGSIRRDDRSLTLAFVRDVSEQKAYTASLEHQALHDGLTGLANRVLFGEHLLQALTAAKRTDESRAVLVMDLDGFKHVNDTLGHARGDLLLEQVGRDLLSTLRETDTIARPGGGGGGGLEDPAGVRGRVRP